MRCAQRRSEQFCGMSIALIEPFYGGSHKLLVDTLLEAYGEARAFTLPAKKWGWHMRTSAVHFARQLPRCDPRHGCIINIK